MRSLLWVFAGMVLTLGGCTSSCLRGPSYALLPSDSLSVRIAAETPVSLLQPLWVVRADSLPALSVPRTVRYHPSGAAIYVADADKNRIWVLSRQGRLRHTLTDPAFHWPFLSGWKADSLIIYQPPGPDFLVLHERRVVRTFPAPEAPFSYTAAENRWLYFKAVGEQMEGYITRLDDHGRPVAPRVALPGPFWRYVGPLDLAGDTLYSFCAYRPVVDRVFPDGRRDTLFLWGFDSPQLPRSRLFMEGEVDEPPLLIPSGRMVDSLLFVLNVRPGWVRIDAYSREGYLRYVFEPDSVAFASRFLPMDMDVVSIGAGVYEAVVTFLKPEPMIRAYRLDPTVRVVRQKHGTF